jgi:hypothetical protein
VHRTEKIDVKRRSNVKKRKKIIKTKRIIKKEGMKAGGNSVNLQNNCLSLPIRETILVTDIEGTLE